MAQIEDRPDWRMAGHDSPRISRKSRTSHWELTGPSFWTLMEAQDSLFPAPCTLRYGRLNALKIEAPLAAPRAQKAGRPDRWWVGRDFPRVVCESRTDRWALTGSSYCGIIEAMDSLFSESFPSRYRNDSNAPKWKHR